MSEDWKNKGIQPYLKGKPANWSDTDNDWVAFKGNEKLEQELASIKKTQSEILERLDKPIDTQLTGSNVEEEVFDRYIFDGTNQRDYVLIPPRKNVKGAIVVIYIYSAVGDYSSGGLRAKLSIGSLARGAFLSLETDYNYGSFWFYLYPSLLKENELNTSQENVKIAVSPYPIPSDLLQLRLYMDGKPNTDNGEGYDISSKVYWLS